MDMDGIYQPIITRNAKRHPFKLLAHSSLPITLNKQCYIT